MAKNARGENGPCRSESGSHGSTREESLLRGTSVGLLEGHTCRISCGATIDQGADIPPVPDLGNLHMGQTPPRLPERLRCSQDPLHEKPKQF